MIGRRAFVQGALLASAGVPLARAATAAGPVVIAGGGFAGAACALELRRIAPAVTVTVVDPDATYFTCPRSNEVIADLTPLAALAVGRQGLRRAGVRCITASVASIDPERRRVRLSEGTPLSYARLVLAPGIRLLFGQPEGYDRQAARLLPHAWQAGAQTRLLARQLRGLADGATVAISVPAGLMRCPPGPYERASLMAHWLVRHRARCKVLIFDANNHFPRQDLFTAAWQEHYPNLIEWLSPAEGGLITRVDARTRTLYSASGRHPVDLANIIPPQAPGELALAAGLCSGHGWCPVDGATFESETVPQVHVIGDACIAGAMPKSASAARSQALQCARAIAALLQGHAPPGPELDSVCYSLISPTVALAMHGRFALQDGQILPLEGADTVTPPGAQAVTEARRWYEQMRRECFGA